jgi:histidinol phosphatase-like PHP family hydrolase
MKNNQTSFRGLIHIHTTYSYDGTVSLPDFAEIAKSRGINFIILTEHAEDFDDKKMQVLVNGCTNATHDDFLVIPGLEFNINNEIYILGIGIETFIDERDPEELI